VGLLLVGRSSSLITATFVQSGSLGAFSSRVVGRGIVMKSSESMESEGLHADSGFDVVYFGEANFYSEALSVSTPPLNLGRVR